MGQISGFYIKNVEWLGYSYIYTYYSIISINYTLVAYHTHGKQDLKPQVSGLFNDTVRKEESHVCNRRTVLSPR